MNKQYQQQRNRNLPTHNGTPRLLANWLESLIGSLLSPVTILDPCVGAGSLVKPWLQTSKSITGYDINKWPHEKIKFYHKSFFDVKRCSRPDLILCNPPFSGRINNNQMMPEGFLRHLCHLFKPLPPTVLFVPMGFRLNQTTRSGRWCWMQDDGPQIKSIISLPRDMFDNVQFLAEILIFGIKNMKPHYWYGE